MCSNTFISNAWNLSAVLDKFSPGSDASITFPATARLLALVAILPLSSASAERLFSKMRLVGTRLRGLDEANLAQILFLGVEAPWDDGGIPVQAASEYVEAKSTKSDERKLPYVQLATLMDCIRVCTQWRRDLAPKTCFTQGTQTHVGAPIVVNNIASAALSGECGDLAF